MMGRAQADASCGDARHPCDTMSLRVVSASSEEPHYESERSIKSKAASAVKRMKQSHHRPSALDAVVASNGKRCRGTARGAVGNVCKCEIRHTERRGELLAGKAFPLLRGRRCGCL